MLQKKWCPSKFYMGYIFDLEQQLHKTKKIRLCSDNLHYVKYFLGKE